MGLRRLKGRLDAVQGHAHATMSDAQELIALAKDLVEDIENGVYIEAEAFGKKIPIRLRLIPDEEAAKLSEQTDVKTIAFGFGQLIAMFNGAK